MSRPPREPLLRRAAWSARLAVRGPLETRFPFRSPEAIERAQRRRLRETVDHAFAHVPYYRETGKRLGLKPADFTSAEDLAKLPLIERQQLQADPEYFVSEAYPIERYLRFRSGGSSGEPATVYRHPVALFASAAQRERLRSVAIRAAGRRLRLRQAEIFLPVREGARANFNRSSLIPSSLRVRRLELSMLDPPAQQIEALDQYAPDSVVSFGSYLEELFRQIKLRRDQGGDPHLPRVAAFSSDELSEGGRRLISEELGVTVLSAYRAVEAPQIGFECGIHPGYHLNVDLCPLRIIGPGGKELPEGETGDVVTSHLFARGSVLLNYRLGDRAARLGSGCSCGRNLPLLSYVTGRSDEWIVRTDGAPIHGQALKALMRLREDVLGYQLVQESPTLIRAAVVSSAGCDRTELAAWAQRRFRERLGGDLRVEASFVESVPRRSSGKAQPIVPMSPGPSGPKSSRPDVSYHPAGEGDRGAILAVMETANMHNVPSPEMGELDPDRFVVARIGGEIVGAAGYAIPEPGCGKTTLLAVHPEHGGLGIGAKLQERRLEAMHEHGARTVTTNADRPETIEWYKRRFGYREVGSVEKLHEFGDPEVERWTTLELDLDAYMRDRDRA
ncbi:MAG: GNAT family N-acetyltransferase [Solirubrobacterales bacterium]|nr:GNAT family N-acetyltransferase [Solirubrobacterales bacterium]